MVDPTPRSDLSGLVETGVTWTALDTCQGLASLVLKELRIEGTVPLDVMTKLLDLILRRVVDHQRQLALAQLRNPDLRPGQYEATETPCFQVAAAAELLQLTDKESFNQVEQIRIKHVGGTFSKLLEKSDKKGPTAQRRLRAAIWIGAGSERTTASDRNGPKLIDALESAIREYLRNDAVQAELRSRLIDALEPSEQSAVKIPVVDESAIRISQSFRTPQDEAPRQAGRPIEPDLERVIHALADRVRRQLEDEQRQDSVTDPLPIPVRWSTGWQYPADHWGNVRGDRGHSEAIPLSGMIDGVASLFASVPSGRLVVLGEGGAGKSVLVRALALALLERRRPDDLIPVVFRISAWEPTRTSLRDWMTAQLVESYPALKAKAARRGPTMASRLVRGPYILPILDGLDELAPSIRSAALPALNRSLNRDDPLVLTSRPAEYIEAAQGGDVLTGAAVIELQSLTVADLAAYLPRTTRPYLRRALETKWDQVLAHLHVPTPAGNSAALQEVLATPLMASMARLIYSDTEADPAELLDIVRFPDAAVLSDHFLDRFVEVKYDRGPQDHDSRLSETWKPDQARRWLGFLALCMFAQGQPEFAWWRPWRGPVRRLGNMPDNILMSVAFVMAFLLGAVWFTRSLSGAGPQDGLDSILLLCVISCTAVGSVARSGRNATPREPGKPRWWIGRYKVGSSREFFRTLPGRDFLFLSSVSFGVSYFVVLYSTPNYFGAFWEGAKGNHSLVPAAEIGMLVYCAISLVMLLSAPPSLTEMSSPLLVLQKDRRAAIVRALYQGIGVSVLTASMWIPYGQARWLATIPLLIAVAFVCTILRSSYGAWLVRRIGFMAFGWLPRRCLSFLEDAHARGVLRQSGGVYQFRHGRLQARLAMEFLEQRKDHQLWHKTAQLISEELKQS